MSPFSAREDVERTENTIDIKPGRLHLPSRTKSQWTIYSQERVTMLEDAPQRRDDRNGITNVTS